MNQMMHRYCKILTIITLILIIIPSVSAENKIVKITDNGNLYGGISPQSYYYKGEREGIYVVYSRLDRLENNPNGDVDSFIRFYDFGTDTVSDEYLIGRGHGDSHGAPTLCIDDKGYIHVFYGCHSDQLEYAVSTYPEDITSWESRSHSLPDKFGYTYPKAIFANGTLSVFFRSRGHGGISINQGKYACIISYDCGKSWSDQIEFVDASNNQYAISVYPTGVKYANGFYHVCWYLMLESGPYSNYYGPNSNETQYNAYYAKSSDGINWFNIDKSHSSTHITIHEMDKFYQVYNTTNQTKVIGQHNEDYSFIRYRTTLAPRIAVSSSGIPYIGMVPTDIGAIIQYWDKNKWNTIQIPDNCSYIPFFLSKKISGISVNSLGFHNGKIYLTNYGYNGSEEELLVMWRNIYRLDKESGNLIKIHSYNGSTIIFKEGINYLKSSEGKNYNKILLHPYNHFKYTEYPIEFLISKILEPFNFIWTWLLENFIYS